MRVSWPGSTRPVSRFQRPRAPIAQFALAIVTGPVASAEVASSTELRYSFQFAPSHVPTR